MSSAKLELQQVPLNWILYLFEKIIKWEEDAALQTVCFDSQVPSRENILKNVSEILKNVSELL